MKILTIVVVALLVGGGGTAVAVATVGNVDWDEWQLFGNHHEDTKRNQVGFKYSVIHTDPEYNSEDGMYYAVTKLQVYEVSGKMILIKPTGNGDISATETPGGILLETQFGDPHGNQTQAKCLLPDVHFETMTIRTYEHFSEPTYRAELLEKYGLSENARLEVRHYKEFLGPDCFRLYAHENNEEKMVDGDFKHKMVEKTVTAAVLSENTIYELQHIDPTVEASLDSIYTVEKIFNRVFSDGYYLRIIEE